MNKKELVNAVAEKSELSKKDSTKVIESLIETISESLADGESVKILQFGNFEVRNRAARDGINPATQEKIRIPETKHPAWKPSKVLKEIIKNS